MSQRGNISDRTHISGGTGLISGRAGRLKVNEVTGARFLAWDIGKRRCEGLLFENNADSIQTQFLQARNCSQQT